MPYHCPIRAKALTNAEGWLWGTGLPTGYSEVVSIAQRQASDPAVATYYLYDPAGNLTDVWLPAVKDADPASPTYQEVLRPHWTYAYDVSGNQILQIDPTQQPSLQAWIGQHSGLDLALYPGEATRFAYDQNGSQVLRELPDGARETWTYDSLGRQATHVDFNGYVTAYIYDDGTFPGDVANDVFDIATNAPVLGELVEERRYTSVSVYDDGSGTPTETTRYAYDSLGRFIAVGDFDGAPSGSNAATRIEATAYDAVTGDVIESDTPEGTVHHAYDPATGQLQATWTGTATAPTAGSGIDTLTAYGYDTQGRLEHVYAFRDGGGTEGAYTGWDSDTHEPTYTGSPLITTYTYDDAGNLATVTQPNGVMTDYDYDALNRLIQETVTNSSSNKIFEQTYTIADTGQRDSVIEKRYDGNGNDASHVLSNVKITWEYDDDGRLVEEMRDAGPSGAPDSGAFDTRDTVAGGDYRAEKGDIRPYLTSFLFARPFFFGRHGSRTV